jgi:hypothetical protein
MGHGICGPPAYAKQVLSTSDPAYGAVECFYRTRLWPRYRPVGYSHSFKNTNDANTWGAGFST